MAQFSLHFTLSPILLSCHPPYPLCPGNFSRLRKLAKLFPFSKLCLKLWELAGLDCLAQALLSLPHSSRGNLANSIIHMHFILIDLIRYLWRGPAANFAGSRRLANCSSQTIASMIIVITIIAVLFSSPSCNLISVHLIIIVRRQGGASSRPTLNKGSFSVRGL